jgi:hypothetical protein
MWSDNRTKIRRFLRDPDGNIWSDAMIRRQWNDSQREITAKTGVLEDAEAVHVPPFFESSYLQDFEYPFLDHDEGPLYQALHYFQQAELVTSFSWEQQVLAGVDVSPTDNDSFIYPWEGYLLASPSRPIPLILPKGFHKAIMVAWDKEQIDYYDLKEIQNMTPDWLTHSGKVIGYWRPDITDPIFHLFPNPSTVGWEEEDTETTSPNEYSCSYSWENSVTYFGAIGAVFTKNYESTIDYVFSWEESYLGGPAHIGNDPMRGMWSFESDSRISGTEVVIGTGDSSSDDIGTIMGSGSYLSSGDLGVTTDIISKDNNALFIFKVEPEDISTDDDEPRFPRFIQKYVEFATLERAFSADTDGMIESLRDYWAMRKQVGIEAIKKFQVRRRTDRDYRLQTFDLPGRSGVHRHPRLPDEYPNPI